MNKSDYIREVDELHASDLLKSRILQTKPAGSAKLKKRKKIPVIIAACLVVAVLVGGVFGAVISPSLEKASSITVGESSEDYNVSGNTNEMMVANGTADGAVTASAQKLIKTAFVNLETKDADELVKKIDSQLDTLKGYTESLSQNKYAGSLSIETSVCVPADELEGFLDFLEESGTVTSKNIKTVDVTDDYNDTESQINALETEEKALLEILAKSETVQDTMSVQERLASVRGDIESLKRQKGSYDQRIAYSEVSISISEVDRVKKTSTSFGSQVREKFSESIYNIGQFFRGFAVLILGASPYFAIAAVVIAVAVIIIRKKKK